MILEFTKIYTDPQAWNVPTYRRPSAKQVENIFPAFRRQERLATNSFEALSKFAQMNTDRVYQWACTHPLSIEPSLTLECSYSSHEPNADEPTKLTCASSDTWSKDSAILHSRRNGVGFDSAHRHKNENFAPVTLLTTVDSNGRMVPGVFIPLMEIVKHPLTETSASLQSPLVSPRI